MMKKINFFIFILACLVLLSFDVYKASHASMTHDECITYINYVHTAFMDIISYKHPFPNNHILNTLLIKLFEFIFGSYELVFRMPNIFSHFIYLFFCYRIVTRFDEKYFIPFFVLLNANPFLIDFFSLARGYGIAIGLMSGAIYFYTRYLECRNYKYHILALVMMCFASLANFALLNVYLLFLLLHNFFEAQKNKNKFSWKGIWNTNKINFIVTVLFSIILYEPLRRIVVYHLIDFGGKDGFWYSTVNSVIASVTYYSTHSYSEFFSQTLRKTILLFCILFLIRCIFFIRHFKTLNLHNNLTLMFGILLFGVVLSCELQHMFFGTSFLMWRFALFLYPLFMFFLCFLISDFKETKIGIVLAGFSYLLATIFLIHSANVVNTRWYNEWKYDSDTKEMLAELNKVRNQNQASLHLGITWVFEPAINFTVKQNNLTGLKKWIAMALSQFTIFILLPLKIQCLFLKMKSHS